MIDPGLMRRRPLLRVTKKSDGQGGWTEELAEVARPLVAVRRRRGSAGAQGGQPVDSPAYQILGNAGADIRQGDRVRSPEGDVEVVAVERVEPYFEATGKRVERPAEANP